MAFEDFKKCVWNMMIKGSVRVHPVGYDHHGSIVMGIDKDRASRSKFLDFDTNYDAQTGITVGTDVDTGARVRLLNLWYYNKESSDVTVVLKDSTTQVAASVVVPSTSGVYLDETDLRGYSFTTSVVVDPAGSFSSGGECSFGYYVESPDA